MSVANGTKLHINIYIAHSICAPILVHLLYIIYIKKYTRLDINGDHF